MFITALAIAGLGIFVYVRNFTALTNKLFFFLSSSIFIWLIGFGVVYSCNNVKDALLWGRFTYIGIIFIPSTTLHFTLTLIGINKRRGTLIRSSYIFSIFFLLLSRTNLFINGMGMFFWGYYPRISLAYYPFIALFFLFYALSLYHLYIYAWGKEKHNITLSKCIQLKYCFWAFVIALLASLDFVAKFGPAVYPAGYLFMLCFVSILAYAIIKHRLLEIDIVVKKTLVYSTLISVITILYFLLISIIEKVFRAFLNYNSTLQTISIIAFFSIIFIPLKNQIQRIIDKYFFRGSIDQIDEENLRLREELQKTEKLKAIATLAAGMAHEIKNPLTSIKTFTEYLPKKHNDPVFVDKFNAIVGNEVDRMNNIVKQLLEFSRPSELKLKKTDINSLLDETLSLLNNDLLKYNIKAQKDYSDIASISVDPAQIRQVFLNLFLNAIDSMKTGGIIHIATGQENTNEVFVSISDAGQGIPKEDIGRIFDPFFTRKDEGTGLGLSVVHGIIKKHRGEITVKSFPEKGTSFMISLPTH
jgi:signal transduction histidine kinase